MARSQPDLTLGVEEEYLLVSLETGELIQEAPSAFMARCKAALGDQVTHELLQSQIEIGTKICRDVNEVRQELQHLRQTLAELAEGEGMGLLAASTHPSASWRDQHSVDLDRYRLLTQDFQAIARRLVICGMHVHTGISDDDLRIDLMNQVTYFLPHLLALSSSSPFWEGHNTGLKSFRPTIFGDLPRSGLPSAFDSFSEYQLLLDDLNETGLCTDPTKIWWDIRPSVHNPTLEMRICDVCTQVEDAVCIAALFQATLATLYRLHQQNQQWRLYHPMLVAENKWRAQRFGVHGELADFGRKKCLPFAELVSELLALIETEATALGCVDETKRAAKIANSGTSADHQLAVYQAAIDQGQSAASARRAVIDWLLQETTRFENAA